jgi:serine/threonine protein phosphatase PrpC
VSEALTVVRCPGCGAAVPAGDRFCEACGRLLVTGPGPAGGLWEAGDRVEAWLADAAGVCDRGLVRERNEDAMALGPLDGGAALVVCDGVSASADAALAARTAAEVTLAVLVATARGGADPEAALREAADEAQRAVAALPFRPDGGAEPPASTLVAALLRGGRATIGWLGDSRAYLLDTDGARQLSSDHLRDGHLTRWLGPGAGAGRDLPVRSLQLPDAGYLLLCSDGMWNYVPGAERLDELVAAVPEGAGPLVVARRLVDFARAAGGHDNITVVAATVGREG